MMLVHITSHLLDRVINMIPIFLMKQIVVEGDESNPTDCITQYPISDTADNSGM